MQNQIPKNWQKVRLGDAGYEVRNLYEPTQNEELPYIGLEHIERQSLRLLDTGLSSETQSTKKKFSKDDILFGTLRPYFRKVVIPKFDGVCSTDITVLKAKPNYDQKYLFYFIANKQLINYATSSSNGTRMPRANWKTISKSEWYYPSLPVQQKISSILSTLDDKIEINNKIAKTLEEMAQALFKEWFALPSVALAKEGELTTGWKVGKLSDIATIIMGQSPASEFYNQKDEGLPFHQGVTNFGNRFLNHEIYCTQNNRIAKKGDILFSVRAPVGRLNIADTKISLGRGVAGIRQKNGYQSYLYYFLKSLFKKEDSLGGGSIFPAVTRGDMENMKLQIPDINLVEKFENTVGNIDKKIALVESENRRLTALRDLLLPKLMRGEIGVL